jgi:hypothetical protein
MLGAFEALAVAHGPPGAGKKGTVRELARARRLLRRL